jgi:magnesium-transporting ATPase (P-type)
MVTKAMLKIPFTSSRKRMSTQVQSLNGKHSYILMKGASEKVVEACSKIHQWDGQFKDLSANDKRNL